MATVHENGPDPGLSQASRWVPQGIDLTRLAEDPFARRRRVRRAAMAVLRHLLDGLVLSGVASAGAPSEWLAARYAPDGRSDLDHPRA